MTNSLTRGLSVLVTLTGLAGAMPAAAEEQHGEKDYKNTLAGFVGITSEERRENGLSIGLEYERHITEHFGIGAILGERTFGDIDTWVFAIPFAYHTGHWKIYAAPGFEHDIDSNENEPLVRLGVEYGFELGQRWEISPQLDTDFVDGDVVFIAGVALGWKF